MESEYVTEVPSSLKQLARLVVRGFYSIEDCLIIDMLVRNPCMKEDDMCDLLKFEKKQFRGRIGILKNDKFVQLRLKMETGPDGKTQKVNYYYINYKSFVNVVKYKLDHMRKKMETEERDATSRASFKCHHCPKTFTDLEADHLFDPASGEFRCYLCRRVVVEDQAAMPKTDTRLLLARFNEQMEPLYSLLRDVEDVKLAPSLLEPEPTDMSHLQRDSDGKLKTRSGGENWSGEATRQGGLRYEETRVDVTIGDDPTTTKEEVRKERPIWMSESTVITPGALGDNSESSLPASLPDQIGSSSTSDKTRDDINIMSVLLQHETKQPTVHKVESSDDEAPIVPKHEPSVRVTDTIPTKHNFAADDDIEFIDSDDEDEQVPLVSVGDLKIPITEVDSAQIAKMTPTEKDAYIQVYQDYYDQYMN